MDDAMSAERWNETQARIAALSRRIVQVQDDERRRLATQVHDDIGPSLAALQIDLGRVDTLLQRGGPDASDAAQRMLRETIAQLREIVADVRSLGSQWRPAVLERHGLLAAIEAAARRFDAQGLAVSCDFLDMPTTGRLPAEAEATLYRGALECLTNCVKHSQATQAEVGLSIIGQAVVLTVQDDGIGIDASRDQPADDSGLGLLSMRERAELLGGEVRIEVVEGGGTRVTISLPISPADAARAD